MELSNKISTIPKIIQGNGNKHETSHHLENSTTNVQIVVLIQYIACILKKTQ